jgi:hypothetical protein
MPKRELIEPHKGDKRTSAQQEGRAQRGGRRVTVTRYRPAQESKNRG